MDTAAPVAAPTVITPEQQISNLIRALRDYAARKPFDGQLPEIRVMLRDLADDWASYQAHDLQPIIASEESPF